MFSITGDGCIKCKDGYYRDGFSCSKCLKECGTCNNKDNCLTCNSTNFMRINENKCYSQNELIGCKNESKTIYGCNECSDGYYLKEDNECNNCSEHCILCLDKTGDCNKCENDYILNDKQCIHYSKIPNCKSEENNKCSKCSFWYKPNSNGTYCKLHVVWLILLIILIIIFDYY